MTSNSFFIIWDFQKKINKWMNEWRIWRRVTDCPKITFSSPLFRDFSGNKEGFWEEHRSTAKTQNKNASFSIIREAKSTKIRRAHLSATIFVQSSNLYGVSPEFREFSGECIIVELSDNRNSENKEFSSHHNFPSVFPIPWLFFPEKKKSFLGSNESHFLWSFSL